MQTEPTRKVEKKEEKKSRLWTTDANRLQITVNLKKMRHLRRAFHRFCASAHPSYKCYMLENLAFFHNSSKTPDDADIANCKHYSAPAGALTFLGLFFTGLWHIISPFYSIISVHYDFVTILLAHSNLNIDSSPFQTSLSQAEMLWPFTERTILPSGAFHARTDHCATSTPLLANEVQ